MRPMGKAAKCHQAGVVNRPGAAVSSLPKATSSWPRSIIDHSMTRTTTATFAPAGTEHPPDRDTGS